MTLAQLWQKRLSHFLNELGKYGRLIFNDHFSIILFMMLGFGAFFYQDQLVKLQAMDLATLKWPVLLSATLVLALIFHLGRPLLLTLDPDKSYLFARGKKWQAYWLKGTILAVVLPIILLLVMYALMSPFISLVTAWSDGVFIAYAVCLVWAKLISFLLMYLNIFDLGLGKVEKPLKQGHHTLAFVLVLLVSFAFSQPIGLIFMSVVLVLLTAYVGWAMTRREQQLMQFNYVIEQEEIRTATFYKWIAIFADVPHLVPSVKRRQYLDGLLEKLSGKLPNRESYMYIRMLFRHTAYSGVWIRVMIFIALLLVLVDKLWMAAALGFIGHLLTVVQLVPLIHYYDAHPIQRLYPIKMSNQYQAFQKTMLIIFFVQTLVYALVWVLVQGFSLTWLTAIGIWLILALLLIYIYIPAWSRKQAKKINRF